MSSDGKEPGAVWQGPTNSSWGHSFDQAQSPDQDDLSFFPDSQDEEEEHPDVSLSQREESFASRLGPVASLLGLFKQFRQYVTIILLPLLFGGLTCLFVLLFVMTGRAVVPTLGLWIILAIIIIIALAQGLVVYSVGTNNGFRVVFTIVGLFLFMLVGCFTVFGPLAGLVLLVLLVIVSIALARLTIHPVPEGYVDIAYSFGKYNRTIYRGFNLLMPWEKVMHQLNVEETQWICPVQRIQLSHDQDVILRAALSYQLVAEDAYLAVTQVNHWEESLRELFITALQSIVPTFTPDDFLIWPQGFHSAPRISQELNAFAEGSARWEHVSNLLFQQMRDKVALWGVQINWVSIRDVYLGPHEQVMVQAHKSADVEPEATTQVTKVEPPAQPPKAPPVLHLQSQLKRYHQQQVSLQQQMQIHHHHLKRCKKRFLSRSTKKCRVVRSQIQRPFAGLLQSLRRLRMILKPARRLVLTLLVLR